MTPLPLIVVGVLALVVGAGRVGPVLEAPYHEPGYDLRLCPDAKVDSVALYTATKWWAERGVWFVVDHPPTSTPCIPIYVDPTLGDVGLRGLTTFTADGTGGMVLVSSGRDALALAHELGHVAGYGHTPLAPSGCMMAPKRVGWSDRGLPKDVRLHDTQGW